MRSKDLSEWDGTEVQEDFTGKVFGRSVEKNIRKALKFFPVVICTGGRQSGKTTMLRQALPEFTYVTLDLPSVSRMAEETPELFFQKYDAPLIVDEIQYAPALFRYLKLLVDANRHTMGQYVLTGSQVFSLMEGISESLAGRIAIVEMEGLSMWEAGVTDVLPFMVRGGFPELHRVPEFPRDMFFSSYVATYLERDVRQIVNVGNLRDFERLMRLLALQSGNLLEMSKVASSIGISVSTVKAWISALERSGQITLLQPWSNSEGKRLVRTPKFYFNDSGLLCWLLGVDEKSLIDNIHLGAIWESFVFSQIRRLLQQSTSPYRAFFYRDKDGKEVDFIIEFRGSYTLIECKYSEFPQKKDLANLLYLKKIIAQAESGTLLELKNAESIVVCRTHNTFLIDTENGIFARPVDELTDVFSVELDVPRIKYVR